MSWLHRGDSFFGVLNKFPTLYRNQDSLPYSQKHITEPYPERDKSSLYPPNLDGPFY
jgi:hypothetical protein